MIAGGLLPYLCHHYGEDVLVFKHKTLVLKNKVWRWYDATKCIINPMGGNLTALETVDSDYDFSTYGDLLDIQQADINLPNLATLQNLIPMAATILA